MFGAGDHSFWRRCRPILAQVRCCFGAGKMLFGRRWDTILAQARFLAGDLRHESCAHALPWRRSHLFFHTCSSAPYHLRQHTPSPAPICPTTCTSVRHHLLQRTLSPGTAHLITYANALHHLRQRTSSPAPVPRDRSAGPSRRQFRGPSWRLFLSFCLLLKTM